MYDSLSEDEEDVRVAEKMNTTSEKISTHESRCRVKTPKLMVKKWLTKKDASSVGLHLKNYHRSPMIPHLGPDVRSAAICAPTDLKMEPGIC